MSDDDSVPDSPQRFKTGSPLSRSWVWVWGVISAMTLFTLVAPNVMDMGAELGSLEPAPQQETSSSAADDGTVKLVEQGYSELDSDNDADLVTWGAVVSNTSTTNAAGVILKPIATSKDDNRIGVHDDDYGYIRVIPPGERIGFGAMLSSSERAIADLTIEVSEVEWFADNVINSGKLTTGSTSPATNDEEYVPDPDSGEDDRLAGMTVEIESDYECLVDAGVGIIYRDKAGELIGGGGGAVSDVPPGSSHRPLATPEPRPDDLAPDATEVYAYGGPPAA